MNIYDTKFEDVKLIKPRIFSDDRGFFFESFNKILSDGLGLYPCNMIQDNHSRSSRGVLRGLHYQYDPPMGKLLRVVHGRGLDVVVDIRENSNTFGEYESFLLSDENNHIIWVPAGFAHGFLALEDNTHLCYKTDALYNQDTEGSIYPLDPELNIEWELDTEMIILSEKDKDAQTFDLYKHNMRF